MIEYMQTVGKVIIQGVREYIDNDLENYIPFFIFAAIFLIASLIRKMIKKSKNK